MDEKTIRFERKVAKYSTGVMIRVPSDVQKFLKFNDKDLITIVCSQDNVGKYIIVYLTEDVQRYLQQQEKINNTHER